MAELERTRPAQTKVVQLEEIRTAEEELRRGGDVAVLLRTYYQADVILVPLERYVGAAVSAYDDYVQQEIDRGRGK
jgi:hypothetical protein